MTLIAESRIVRNRKAKTHYVTIPSVITQDSTYPFREATEVVVEILPESKELVVRLPSRTPAASKRK